MNSEQFRRMEALYDAAAGMEPSERTCFIDDSCAADEEMRRELLAAFRDAGSGFTGVVANAAATAMEGEDNWTGRHMGPYRIVRPLGHGGMGTVYLAVRDDDQFHKEVAIKTLRFELHSGPAVSRFRHERQILAHLEHPNIARLLDGGATERGTPYIVLEYVPGSPITEWCEQQRLSLEQQLGLFCQVCDAVQYAHQHLIVHRDIKPGNVLVTSAGVPKLLDFGIAKLLDADAPPPMATATGALLMTPDYVSPEQVRGEAVSTATDVYALGAVLYQLLTGQRPHLLQHYDAAEIARVVCETEIRPPSTLGNRRLRGDLDNIVLKAMKKDPARRYSSAVEFSEDIRRYLDGLPINARPDTSLYRTTKFVRRHWIGVSATAAAVMSLAVGVAVATRAAVQARQADQTAQAVSDFLRDDLLAQASASNQLGSSKPDPDLKVRTALDRAAARIGGKFGRQPEVEAAIRDTVGQTYSDLGMYPEARAQLERALELHRQALGMKDPKTLKTAGRLGRTAFLQGKYPEAEALLGQALDVQRRILGPDHVDTLNSMAQLGNVYYWQGKYVQAETLMSQNLEIRRRVFGPDSPDTIKSMNGLASASYAMGKYAQAEALFSEAVEIDRRLLGLEHPDTLGVMNNQALNYVGQGRYAEAEALDTLVLQSRRRVLGPEHPDTLGSMVNLANDYGNQGKREEAGALYRQALEIQRRVLGSEHLMTLRSMNNLAETYDAEGKYGEAEVLFGETLEIERRLLGTEHSDTLICMNNLADAYGFQGKYAASEGLFSEVLGISRHALGPEHPLTLAISADSASMYLREGKYALAQTSAAQVLAGRRHALGSEHPDTMTSATDLALAYVSQGNSAASEPLAREALEFFRTKQPNDWQRFLAESLLGASLSGLEKYAEAEPLLLEGYQGMAERKDRIVVPNWYYLDHAEGWIVQLYQAWGKPEKVAEWHRSRRTGRVR